MRGRNSGGSTSHEQCSPAKRRLIRRHAHAAEQFTERGRRLDAAAGALKLACRQASAHRARLPRDRASGGAPGGIAAVQDMDLRQARPAQYPPQAGCQRALTAVAGDATAMGKVNGSGEIMAQERGHITKVQTDRLVAARQLAELKINELRLRDRSWWLTVILDRSFIFHHYFLEGRVITLFLLSHETTLKIFILLVICFLEPSEILLIYCASRK